MVAELCEVFDGIIGVTTSDMRQWHLKQGWSREVLWLLLLLLWLEINV
jgi:hypothetical protein